MKLAVGFLTYNQATAGYLPDFLPSLEAALAGLAPSDYQVLALDNSSPEEEANRLTLENFNDGRLTGALPRRPYEYVNYGQNLGFSRAYNILMDLARQAGAEYFFMINPDTILEPTAIQYLIEALADDGALGSAAPKILRWNFTEHRPTKTIDSLGLVLRPGLHFVDYGQGGEDGQVAWPSDILGPSGAAGLFRMSALAKIASPAGQYFDESFFMYKEDCDLAYRLFLAGYTSRLVERSVIYHDRTAAAATGSWLSFWRGRNAKSRQVRAWSFKNQNLLFCKYWKNQNFVNKFFILSRATAMFTFSLILEQFLLKEYGQVWRVRAGLTNTK
jgi:GT2 family glycosyltransferase